MLSATNVITDVIDVEAIPEEDFTVSPDVAEHDIASIHGDGWRDALKSMDSPDAAILSLEQWLGKEAVSRMRSSDIEALRRGVAMLPEPEGEESFVWDAIRSPDDIGGLAEAIVGYRQFDLAALVISDAMGGNGHFRKAVRQSRLPADMKISDLVSRERAELKAVYDLIEGVDHLVEVMEGLFGKQPFTVGTALCALGAAGSIATAIPMMSAGFSLPRAPTDDELEVADKLRRRIVGASDAVKAACSVLPLQYSDGVMSGVKRSLIERRAGDFMFAVQALGGRVEGRERLTDAGRAFAAYFAAQSDFTATVEAMGYTPEDHSALLSHVLLRRCLKSAARGAGVDWGANAPFLSASMSLGADEAGALATRLAIPGLSGRLKAVCENTSKELAEVTTAANRFTVRKEYRIEAARRVAEAAPGATLASVRNVMDSEPQIARFRDVLKEYGAVSRADVDPLERHLEWMISAYALPVPDEAVSRIVETRGGIIPLRLASAQEAA